MKQVGTRGAKLISTSLIIYTVSFNYSRRVNRWVVSPWPDYHRASSRFCIVNFHFLWNTSYAQKLAPIRYQTFSECLFSVSSNIDDRWKKTRGSNRIRKFDLSHPDIYNNVSLHVWIYQIYKVSKNPSNYRTIKRDVSLKFIKSEI